MLLKLINLLWSFNNTKPPMQFTHADFWVFDVKVYQNQYTYIRYSFLCGVFSQPCVISQASIMTNKLHKFLYALFKIQRGFHWSGNNSNAVDFYWLFLFHMALNSTGLKKSAPARWKCIVSLTLAVIGFDVFFGKFIEKFAM